MAARMDVFQCIAGNDQSSVSSLWSLPAAINLVAQHGSSFWLSLAQCQMNKGKAEQKEGREEQLFSISLCFSLARLSLFPIMIYFHCIFKGVEMYIFRVQEFTAFLYQQRGERREVLKRHNSRPRDSFFQSFLWQFSEQACPSQLQQTGRRNIVPFLHLAVFLPFFLDSFLAATLVFSGVYFIYPSLFYSKSNQQSHMMGLSGYFLDMGVY